ncbi:MAG: UDP-N-acetylglucosamine diphosphorylase/glucosamine-1-phosphate N-acetyltransferase [Legionellales bacterium RIFCSPHIGHO2_12_FULL_35_11]|nr:MAG: UDP-N-acetylglucosamine diphosphorylase/glucosamine-1-phosphate N-acetyltransferase [Legionellales bacterium RIFCSPHIGHO2_12_FULL_35_11]
MNIHVVILAAGLGKRMFSSKPKVMHEVGGAPILSRVIDAALGLQPAQIHVVIGSMSQIIKDTFSHLNLNFVVQNEQLGTGHAVHMALPYIPNDAQVLILSGDAPLLRIQTIKPLVEASLKTESLSLLVANLENPFGLGRIVRDENKLITAIVEEKDASDKIKDIREIYTGICCAKSSDLHNFIPLIKNRNAQSEYYLTDLIEMTVSAKKPISSVEVTDYNDILGVNNRVQLQLTERIFQSRMANELLLKGATLADASRIDVRGTIDLGQDVYIDVNNVFLGNVYLGDNSTIEPNCVLKNVKIGKNCKIFSNSVLENCVVSDNCQIGPFARIRPGTTIMDNCKIGNFVEVKNCQIAEGSKANHLSYLGDSTIGKDVNIGAGTITCNYDGANKHKIVIEDGVFIGSDTQIVAPITIGKNATIGAGSTIRKDVPAEELTITTSTQKIIYGWKRPQKKDN